MDRSIENTKKRCDALLTAMLGAALVEKWWNGPNKAFDMETPITVFEKDPNKVYSYLMGHVDGYW